MIEFFNKPSQAKDQNTDHFPKNIPHKITPFFYTDISIIKTRYQQFKQPLKITGQENILSPTLLKQIIL